MSERIRIPPQVALADVNWPLLILGVSMIVAGVAVPGTQAEVVMALIVLGAGLAVTGALGSQFRQFEIGPKGIKLNRDDSGTTPAPWVAAEAETLGQIAQLVLGNRDLAREVVEDVLAKIHRYRGRIPPNRRDAAVFKTLVAELHRREKKMWFSGRHVVDESDGTRAAVRGLEFPIRVAFVLSLDLPAKDVADILDRSEGEVSTDIETATKVLSPYIEDEDGGTHVWA